MAGNKMLQLLIFEAAIVILLVNCQTKGGTITTTSAPCTDKDPRCREWAAFGQCVGSSEYIENTCSYSCGFCTPEGEVQAPDNLCVDLDSECWRNLVNGTCITDYPLYVMYNCKYTCGYCPTVSETAAISDIVPKDRCEDTSIYCAEWAGEGECETNPMFMMKNCTKTCGVCAADVCYTCSDTLSCVNTVSECNQYCPKDNKCVDRVINSACLLEMPFYWSLLASLLVVLLHY